jgi:hypothetical protein
LALYDSEQTGVRQRNTDKTATEVVGGHWMVRSLAGTTIGAFIRQKISAPRCVKLCPRLQQWTTYLAFGNETSRLFAPSTLH